MSSGAGSDTRSTAIYLVSDEQYAYYACSDPDGDSFFGKTDIQQLTEDQNLNERIANKTPDLAFVNSKFLLYPANTWTKEQAMNALRKMLNASDSYVLKSDPLPFDPEMECIFAIEQEKLEAFYRWHLGLKLHHVVPVYIHALSQLPAFRSNSAVYLHLMDGSALLIGVIEGKIHLANLYRLSDKTDLLYFTLAVFKEVGLDPDRDKLFYSGLMEKGGRFYNSVQDYVRHVDKAPIKGMGHSDSEWAPLFSMFEQPV